MADDKDQNLDKTPIAETEVKALNMAEIDQAIAAEDPKFLAQVSVI